MEKVLTLLAERFAHVVIATRHFVGFGSMLLTPNKDTLCQLIRCLAICRVFFLLQKESTEGFVQSTSELLNLLFCNDRFPIGLLIVRILVIQ